MRKVYENVILGIDPGKHGAMATLSARGEILEVVSFSGKSTEQIIAAVYQVLPFTFYSFIEQVTSSPQQGVVSAFTFGKNYGALLGALNFFPEAVCKVRPQEWQGALGCLSGGNKKSLLEYAKKIYPGEYERKAFNQSSADAVLIARYGYLRKIKSKEKETK